MRVFALSLAIAAALGGGLAWLAGWPFWAGFPVVLLAMLANGHLADWEDRRPGGFLNPSGDPIDRGPGPA